MQICLIEEAPRSQLLFLCARLCLFFVSPFVVLVQVCVPDAGVDVILVVAPYLDCKPLPYSVYFECNALCQALARLGGVIRPGLAAELEKGARPRSLSSLLARAPPESYCVLRRMRWPQRPPVPYSRPTAAADAPAHYRT